MNTDALLPGERLGRYTLGPELGRGAMGMVFLAEDTLLKQRLCVKVLHPALAQHPEAAERFNREIVLARRIAHKGVCRLHDIHEEKGFRFITMEFVEGVPLRDLLLSDVDLLPIERVLAIGANICEALAAAHDVGVVHRDLKPRNIMVRDDNEVTVLDFGIARALDNQSSLTLPGVALGTRHYIAPEVWAGRPATPRSDEFSVGVILFNCITGKMPFSAAKDVLLLESMSKGPPPAPSLIRRESPVALDTVVLRALAFRPEDRFPDVLGLARALRDIAAGGPTRPMSVTGPVPIENTLPPQPALVVTEPPPTLPGRVMTSDTDPPAGPPITLGDVTVVSVTPTDPTVIRSDAPSEAPSPELATQVLRVDVATRVTPETFATGSWVVGGRPVDLPAIPKELQAMPATGGTTSDVVRPRRRSKAPVIAAAVAIVAAIAAVVLVIWPSPKDNAIATNHLVPPIEPVVSPATTPTPAPTPTSATAPSTTQAPATTTTDAMPTNAEAQAPEPSLAETPRHAGSSSSGSSGANNRDAKRWNEEKGALEKALSQKGIIAGDDADLDKLKQRALTEAKARHYGDAADLMQEAKKRADAVLIDKGFVKKKLVRFNERYDAVNVDGAARAKLDAMSAEVLKHMKEGRYDDANKTLDEAFVALSRTRS